MIMFQTDGPDVYHLLRQAYDLMPETQASRTIDPLSLTITRKGLNQTYFAINKHSLDDIRKGMVEFNKFVQGLPPGVGQTEKFQAGNFVLFSLNHFLFQLPQGTETYFLENGKPDSLYPWSEDQSGKLFFSGFPWLGVAFPWIDQVDEFDRFLRIYPMRSLR